MRGEGVTYCFLDSTGNEILTTGKIKHVHVLEQAFKVSGENLNCYAAVSDYFFFCAIPNTYVRRHDRFLKIRFIPVQ